METKPTWIKHRRGLGILMASITAIVLGLSGEVSTYANEEVDSASLESEVTNTSFESLASDQAESGLEVSSPEGQTAEETSQNHENQQSEESSLEGTELNAASGPQAIPFAGEVANNEYLTVAQAKVAEKGQSVTIEGMINGTMASASSLNPANKPTHTNITIADRLDADASQSFPIQLPAGDLRSQYNVKDNPDLIGRYVRVTNEIGTYFTVNGFKGTSVFELLPVGYKPNQANPPREEEPSNSNNTSNQNQPETPENPDVTPPEDQGVLSTIEQVRSGEQGQVYRVAGKVISKVNAWGGQGFYIQDAQGKGIYIYPRTNLQVQEGQSIQLTGQLGSYNNELQLVDIRDVTQVEEIQVPTVPTVTLDQLSADRQSTLVKLEKVTVGEIAADSYGTVTFNVSDEKGGSLAIRVDNRSGVNDKNLLPLIGQGDTLNITGILSTFREQIQLKPFDLAHFEVVEKASPTEEPKDLEKMLVSTVQGASHTSTYTNKEVALKPVVVTMVDNQNNFYVQDVDPDGDNTTSDGIYVRYNNHNVKPGDILNLVGRVREFHGQGYAEKSQTDLTITRLDVISLEKTGTMAVPAPIILGEDRQIPAFKVDSDGLAIFNPDQDAIDFWESLEGMLVAVRNPNIIGPQQYREIYVLPEGYDGPLNNAYGITLQPDSFNPYKIPLLLKNNLVVKSGDKVQGLLVGPVTYSYTNYKVSVGNLFADQIIEGALKPEQSSLKGDETKLSIASYNIENFSADPSSTSDEKVARIAKSFVEDLNQPDIITVVEMQDNNGQGNDGTVAADQSAQRLIDTIVAAGGPRYVYIDIAPENNQDGGAPGANIRTGFLYNPDRVKLADKPIASVNERLTWQDGELSHAIGRIDPTNPIWANTRKPLVAEFEFQNQKVHLVAVHLNSKRGDDGVFGANQPVKFKSEDKRHQMADIISNFLNQGQAQNPNLKVAVMGDFNDFEFTETLKRVSGDQRFNLVAEHDQSDRYTYFYQGNYQSLDNVVLSNNLRDKYAFDIVHVNSPFMNEHGRASDHDPLLLVLDFSPEQDKPVEPSEPENPTEPETPENPNNPELPDNPTQPEVPEKPTTPVVPERPDEPTSPVTPEMPTRPENSANPNVTENSDANQKEEGATQSPELGKSEKGQKGLSQTSSQASQNTLPATGESDLSLIFTASVMSILAGLGLVAKKERE